MGQPADRVRFKSLTLFTDETNTWMYTYDALARVSTAQRFAGTNTAVAPTQSYAYSFDVAGNRTQQVANGVTTNSTYDAANRLSSSGYSYDASGRMTSDGTNTYTWDRANRYVTYLSKTASQCRFLLY